MKTKQDYNPTDIERCAVASEYDNIHISHFDSPSTPQDYICEGACVTLIGGTTYWVLTIQEAKDIGMIYDQCDTIKMFGRKWVVTLS
jgi:hypothetical protein